jgi:hypothetical protein
MRNLKMRDIREPACRIDLSFLFLTTKDMVEPIARRVRLGNALLDLDVDLFSQLVRAEVALRNDHALGRILLDNALRAVDAGISNDYCIKNNFVTPIEEFRARFIERLPTMLDNR